MIDLNELSTYAKHFLHTNFQINDMIPIKRNNRLRTSLGRYVFSTSGEPLRIELSGNLLKYGSKDTIYGVLRHECIHYAFHLKGKNMHDGNEEFERALRQLHAP